MQGRGKDGEVENQKESANAEAVRQREGEGRKSAEGRVRYPFRWGTALLK